MPVLKYHIWVICNGFLEGQESSLVSKNVRVVMAKEDLVTACVNHMYEEEKEK